MKKIVLSGFGLFGDYLVNSSEKTAIYLAKNPPAGFQILPIIFEANIPQTNRGKELLEHARIFEACAIVSIGMASEKRGLCIEKWAVNLINNPRYCPSAINGTSIDKTVPHSKKIETDLVPWNLDAFLKTTETEGITVEHSINAGGFCCNHLAYQVRSAQLQESDSIPYIFIHVPCCPEAIKNPSDFFHTGKVTMTVNKIARGIELLLTSANLADS